MLQPLTLEAVTVTAMLREQEVKDVPFSVAAPTAQLLRTRGVLPHAGGLLGRSGDRLLCGDLRLQRVVQPVLRVLDAVAALHASGDGSLLLLDQPLVAQSQLLERLDLPLVPDLGLGPLALGGRRVAADLVELVERVLQRQRRIFLDQRVLERIALVEEFENRLRKRRALRDAKALGHRACADVAHDALDRKHLECAHE